ncbi:MAG TPA: hypothetical protein VE974_29055 [Thermoanaerobaculia bacterium]|nr:hypothetical protein [Thermoanaerobaculia bacterium]
MLRISLLLCLVVTTAAADELRFGNERFVAPPRPGYGTELSAWNLQVTVTEGDGQFLITWVDERADNPAFPPRGGGSAALAFRVDASGRVLDPHPFALPFYSPTTVWTGTDWIIVGERAARISREGQVTAISDVQFPSPYAPPIGGAAWTGEALVVARVLLGVDGPGIVVRTVDARLQLVEERRFLTDAEGSTVIGVASDGISAVVAYRREHYGNEPTRLAVFGRDGRLISEATLPAGPAYETIAAGRNGYMAIGANPATGRFEGTILDLHGDVRSTEPVVLTSDLSIQFGRHLLWDGTGFTFLRYASASSAARLMSMRFDSEGTVIEQPVDLSGSIPQLPVLAFMGNTVAMAGRIPLPGHSPAHRLDIRVAPGLRSLFAHQAIDLPRAAVPRETPAAAANGTNMLVAWRERLSPRGELNVAATLLHRDGTPVDGSVLALGSGSCHGVAPAVTTNGRDYLVAWTSAHAVLGAIVRADGTVGLPFRIGAFGPCSDAQVSLASNGSQYLAIWSSPDPNGRLQVHGVRISNDGAILDVPQLRIGSAAVETATSTSTAVVSNGTDFLVAWDNLAARVTASGQLLDTPLSLGTGNVHGAWLNGRTYVVAVYEPGFYRFHRIASDGSGGDEWPNPAPARHYAAHQTGPLLPVCDANGCLATGYAGLLRIEDRGNEFALTHLQSNLDFRTMVRPVLVRGDRLMAVYARSVMETPYSHAPAILLRALQAAGRQRSVRH